MSTSFIKMVGALGLACLAVIVGVYAASTGPRLTGMHGVVLSEDIYDFGTIAIDDRLDPLGHDFRLTNHKARPIRIEHVSSSCGCTDVSVSHRVLQPGESAIVHAKMAVESTGKQVSNIWINLGKDGLLTLTLVAHGRRAINLFVMESLVTVTPEAVSSLTLLATNPPLSSRPRPLLVDPPVSAARLVVVGRPPLVRSSPSSCAQSHLADSSAILFR